MSHRAVRAFYYSFSYTSKIPAIAMFLATPLIEGHFLSHNTSVPGLYTLSIYVRNLSMPSFLNIKYKLSHTGTPRVFPVA